ncbi:unnamed protein product [Peniophora sp. CBMAI 1063]|nr:unnamed protein product [Peniophora sp. CBMAI 1063]
MLSQQPAEVLECIVDELDGREDLLALALACSRLHNLIIPEHLSYRRVVVSVYFQPFFDLILSRADLARRVRELTIVNTTSNLVVPRGHAFRRQFDETSLLSEDDEPDAAAATDVGPRHPLDLPALIEDALRHLVRLRRLGFCGKIEQLPFDRILAFHHEQLEGLALDSKEGSDGMTEGTSRPYGAPPWHLWKLSGLRSLDLDIRLGHTYWNPFCDLLGRSPMLESLVMPWFDPGPITYASYASLPPLSYLKRITVREANLALDGDALLSHRIYTFLNDHPSLQEVVWKGRAGYPTRMPRLPEAKRMLNINQAHMLELLRLHKSNEYVVFDLDMVIITNIKLAPRWSWLDLSSIFPPSLRALYIVELQDDIESNGMLDALAQSFENLEELHLPEHGSHYVTKRFKPLHTYPPTKFATRLEIIDEGVRRPKVGELVGRFVNLRSISGVDAGLDAQTLIMVDYKNSNSLPMDIDVKTFLQMSRALTALRTQFPKLRHVNGWCLDTDLAHSVVLTFAAADGLMRESSTRVVLTRESIRIHYAGTVADSQPVPLQYKRPNPILRGEL